MERQELFNLLNTPTISNVIANELLDEAVSQLSRKHFTDNDKLKAYDQAEALTLALTTVLFHHRDSVTGYFRNEIQTFVYEVIGTEAGLR